MSLLTLPLGIGAEHEKTGAGEDQTPVNSVLRRELMLRSQKDQDVRQRLVEFSRKHQLALDSEELKQRAKLILKEMLNVDVENTRWLKTVVAECDWPGQTLVRPDGAQAAFLLVQHASHDRAFQQHCLQLIEAAPPGEVMGAHRALLTDRVRLAAGQKQLYGTQLAFRDGAWQVQGEIEEPHGLNQRREQLGLPPLEDYLRMAAELYGKGP